MGKSSYAPVHSTCGGTEFYSSEACSLRWFHSFIYLNGPVLAAGLLLSTAYPRLVNERARNTVAGHCLQAQAAEIGKHSSEELSLTRAPSCFLNATCCSASVGL